MKSNQFAYAMAFAVAGTVSLAFAQHHQDHGSPGAKPEIQDGREFVRFPPELVEHTLANMRDHLLALQEIQHHLSLDHTDEAARIVEARLGMSSLGLHGAHDVAKFMPQGMQDAGTGMHRAASRLAIIVKDAGVTGDLKPAIGALAAITAQCVGCHASYRIK
jgi:hypothetical protein